MAEIKINMDSLKTFRKTVRHKVQDGSNIFRLGPPAGKASNGYPYQKWGVIWGLSDPSTGNRRPYASPSTYEGKCPIYDYLDLLKVKVDNMQNAMISKGATKDEVKERFKDTNYFISQLRPKTVFAYNAVDKSGQLGILELKSTAHKKILELMNKYIIDYNQDPTSLGTDATDSGVWFDITRRGTGLQTEYGAIKHQSMAKDAKGVPQYQDDREALPESVTEDYDNLAYDLTSIYQKKTYDEMKEILLANLEILGQDNSDLTIEGFGANAESVIEVKQGTSAQSLPQGAGAKIKLDMSEAVGIVTPIDVSSEDLMKMAEDVFA